MSATTTDPASPSPAPDAGERATTPRREVRADIQGLRAVAVSLVVVYHLLPRTLTGGFTGVDVFFAISGFLITLHLVERPPRAASDLAVFWGRRVRRLLPASLLVLVVTLGLSRLVAPETQWGGTAAQARAAAFYVVNWVLARDSVDYLAAENAPSPVQHFWSLSVEEQFYLVWPVLILALGLWARRRSWNPGGTVLAGLAALVAGSFAYSVWETATNPPAAYFVTPTRLWELGTGSLLAVVTVLRHQRGRGPALPEAARGPLAWVGLLLIAWAGVTYTGATPFPGWHAALPVLGATLVIAARAPATGLSPTRLFSVRPVQWLGDVSYSVYLWHWPLIVLLPQLRDHAADTLDRVLCLALTLVLAHLTKVHVEDRFRAPRRSQRLRTPFVLAAAGMVLVLLASLAQDAELARRDAQDTARLAQALRDGGPCFGAAALDPGRSCRPVPFDDVVPSPAQALSDKSNAYATVSGRKDCFAYLPRFPQVRCTFGDRSSSTVVALAGNSHAGQWLPALERLARAHHWRIETYLASGCALADTAQTFPTAAEGRSCSAWARKAQNAIARSRPSAVMYVNRISVAADGLTRDASAPAYEAGSRSVLETWKRAGLTVLAVRDTPAPGTSVPDCVAQHEADLTACDGTRRTWLPADLVGQAVGEVDSPRIRYADLTDHICGPVRCTAVTGGVLTYFDATHLTATFATTLTPYLGRVLVPLVPSGRS